MIDIKVLNSLNAEGMEARLSALREAVKVADFPEVDERMINNHIHTFYSFSPYSPSAAVYAARAEGLATCGIVDHDSIGGADDKCISIYAANGALVAEHYGNGYVALASGTYVVKVDGHSAKMYVK